MSETFTGTLDGSGMHIGIVVGRTHGFYPAPVSAARVGRPCRLPISFPGQGYLVPSACGHVRSNVSCARPCCGTGTNAKNVTQHRSRRVWVAMQLDGKSGGNDGAPHAALASRGKILRLAFRPKSGRWTPAVSPGGYRLFRHVHPTTRRVPDRKLRRVVRLGRLLRNYSKYKPSARERKAAI